MVERPSRFGCLAVAVRRLRLAARALLDLGMAWRLKLGKRVDRVRLPAVREPGRLGVRDVAFAVRWTDRLVALGTSRTGRKCFFRSYVLGSALRRWGVPVVLNVGLRRGPGAGRAVGHCWLSLGDELFAEPRSTAEEYPCLLGAGDEIRYWTGRGRTGSSASRREEAA